MLEEFIENNELNAEIISSPTELPVVAAIKQKKFNPKNIAKVNLFRSKSKEEILVITSFGKEIDIKDIEIVVNEKLLELNEEETIELTGEKKGYVPPISVYGVKVMVDVDLENLNYLVFPLSIKKYLRIPLREIISQNEDISFEQL